jgi:hypothetical protein
MNLEMKYKVIIVEPSLPVANFMSLAQRAMTSLALHPSTYTLHTTCSVTVEIAMRARSGRTLRMVEPPLRQPRQLLSEWIRLAADFLTCKHCTTVT